MPRRPVIPRIGTNETTTAEARIISDRIKTPTWRNTATQPDASQSDAQRQEPADPTTNSATCTAVRNPKRRRSPDPEAPTSPLATKSPGGSRQQYGLKKTVFAIRSALRTFPGLETSAHYYESQESSFSARNFRPPPGSRTSSRPARDRIRIARAPARTSHLSRTYADIRQRTHVTQNTPQSFAMLIAPEYPRS